VSNWYTTREKVKAALEVAGTDANAAIDQHIEGASREIDRILGRRFLPKTQTRRYRWPQGNGAGQVLYLDEDLISVSGITSENGDVTVPVGEVFLEPGNDGPPYSRIEIDTSTTDANAAFAAGDTPQRAVAVTGSWGYTAANITAGTVTSGLASDASATSFVCSNAALIDVGDTLLIESEQLFVSERGTFDSTANLAGDLTANKAGTLVTLSAALVNAGEVILVESEKMYVQSVSSTALTVVRAFDGTTLAAHTGTLDVYVYRTLTVERGVNGTTAATHANSTAISKYQPPLDIQALCRSEAIFNYQQDESGQTGVVGGADGGVNVRPRSLEAQWDRAKVSYLRPLARVLWP
jgi:hypothetical protein